MGWSVGDRLTHRFNPELGPGVVAAIEGRTLVVDFPEAGARLSIAAGSDALEPLALEPGSRARLAEGEPVVIATREAGGRVRLEDGRVVREAELWPLRSGESPFERLARGDVDPLESFALRLDALHLAKLREAEGLGSFLGGRIRLFPHQLHVAERATRTDPVRWLLADEVGLGKTVEACLILNHLVRTGRAERTLVVAPATLTVQWLGELWRKYHQVFALLDEARLADVERDFGAGFNPFETHRRAVVALELLSERRRLGEQAVEAGIDLLIVDEAHHLRRPVGHPGNLAYRAVRPIADAARHVLLLTATPLDEDAHGFFRLLQILRPEELPDDASFEERLASGRPLPPCTSATRRVDVGGLPPRRPAPVATGDLAAWAASLELERAMRALEAENPVARREQLRRVRRALASGAALEPLLDRSEPAAALARRATRDDPRIAWLAARATRWKRAGQKTLVFAAHRETLEAIRSALSRTVQLRAGVFHEELSPGQRDIEVAQFRLPSGPSMLVSTECGGEGRNFEFCTRLVMFDLPWNATAVEQRIGRLDRIGRTRPVEIVYFRPPGGLGAAVVELYEALGVFERPQGGLERELARVEPAIEELALGAEELPGPERWRDVVEPVREGWDRVQRAARQELHRDPYRPELSQAILARVPAALEELTQEVVLNAAEQLALHVESHQDGARWSVELGREARVESLPGVAAGASFLGTFDREEAVRDESIDFFASGHPLVEGLVAWLEDAPHGRVALLEARATGEAKGLGLFAVYRDGPGFDAVAIDAAGRERPEWAAQLVRRPLRSRRVPREAWVEQPGWSRFVSGLAERLAGRGRPVAVAAVHFV
jgi:ATP-dependent helicase HepA